MEQIKNIAMNEIIDIGLIAAKLATLNDEKARMAVSGVSLAYNAEQIQKFNCMIVEYSELLNVVSFGVKQMGYAPSGHIDIARQCTAGITFCQHQINKHQVIAVTDVAMLLFDGINSLNKK